MSMVQRSPQEALIAQVRRPEFAEQVKLALPSDENAQRFIRATVTGLMQNPDIAEADPNSVFQSIIKCAQDGLLPDGREAALVIFFDKKAGAKKAQYLPMIGGYRKIAGEHGWAIRSAVVYENDDFDFELGLEPRLLHRPPRPGNPRGAMIAAYAVGAHKDGRREFEVMDAEEIGKARAASRAKDYGPWVDWPERMAEKTVARRLFKKLPLGGYEKVDRVLAADDPIESVGVLYGPRAREAFQAPPASLGAADTPQPDGPDGGPAGSGEGQQAGDTDTVGSPTASPAPDPYGPDDPEAKQRADEAGTVKAPARTKYAGEAIVDIAEVDLDFLKGSLDPGRRWNRLDATGHDVIYRMALDTYLGYYHPELLREAAA